jgi:hypothetical protein
MAGNSLQAVLNRVSSAPTDEPETPATPKSRKAIAVKAPANQAATAKAGKAKAEPKPSRAATKLIGGHFAPEYSTQLRIIAAEEDTTLQALLTEALNDLFVKKGKARINAL